MGPYRREASTLRHGPPPAELPQTGSWPSRLSESHSLVNVWLTARSSATPALRFIRRSRKPPTRSRRDSDSPSAFARKDSWAILARTPGSLNWHCAVQRRPDRRRLEKLLVNVVFGASPAG